MDIAEKNRIFLEKLRRLPEGKKKIILWAIVIVLAVIMGFFWIRGAIDNISKINQDFQNIKMPDINIPDMPKMPSLDALENITPGDESLIK